MKLSKLKKKYPEAFEKFWKTVVLENSDDDVRNYWKEITDFMDKRGIIIATVITTNNNTFYCQIYYDKKGYEFECMAVTDDFKSRSQAETKAICKAFEILEERIKP